MLGLVLVEGPVIDMSTGPLLPVQLDRGRPLGLQIEGAVRTLIRSGGLRAGAALPSTRALAADLAVSRGVAVAAYAQLAAEGYIAVRRGAAPTVLALAGAAEPASVEVDVPIALARFNLRPDLPDLALFPRADWAAAERASLHRAANTDLAYGEPFGAAELRHVLAPFLARTRGVVATAGRTGVHAGSTQALLAVADALRLDGARRIGVEDPGHRWRTRTLRASGLEVVPIPVDGDGLLVDALDGVDAVVVSPDHHFPSGVALSPGRRRALVEWAVRSGATIVEHDYDGHFRYDRPPAGALQALAPEHVAYVGSTSALLAPTLRIGWSVLPARLVESVADRTFATVVAQPRLPQLALAELIRRGSLDRQLRKVRVAYRRRRDLLVATAPRLFAGASVSGAPVGLFVSLALPKGADEAVVLRAAPGRGLALDGVGEHCIEPQSPGLVLGFAANPEPTLQRALGELAAVLAATLGS
jgi:GntR family transcriptional regulator/MocR family aminotransferase